MAISRSLGGSRFTARPPMGISPPLMCSSPAIIRSSVDLPQPDRPTSTTNSSSPISMSMPSMTATGPNTLRTPRISTDAVYAISLRQRFSERPVRARAAWRERERLQARTPPVSPSMRLSRHFRPALADEEVEVGALMGLHDMLHIEPGIAAVVGLRRRFPGLLSLAQLVIRDVEMEAALLDVEFDHVAVAHQRQGSARGGLGRDVQHHGAVSRAAHARVGNAHDVGNAFLQQLLRNRHVADFGEAGIALGPGPFEHHHRRLVDGEVGRVEALLEMLDALEHHGAALVPHQLWRGRR